MPSSPTVISNLTLFAGEDKLFVDTIFQSDGVTPQDITGWTVRFKVTAYDDPTAVYVMKSTPPGSGIVLTDATNGVLSITLMGADTAGMYAGEYRYAVERIDTGNDAVLTAGLLTLMSKYGATGPSGGPALVGWVSSFNARSGDVVLTTADVDAALPTDVAQVDVANTFVQHNSFGAQGVPSTGTVLGVNETLIDVSAAHNSLLFGGKILLTLNPGGLADAEVIGLDVEVDTAAGNAANYPGGIIGVIGQVDYNSTGVVFSVTGGDFAVFNTAAGTITGMFGVYVVAGNFAAAGVVTNNYGVYVDVAFNAGTMTNNYGVYIADQSGAGSTDSFNIYSLGPTSKNYFEGQVGVGVKVPSASAKLQADSTTKGFLPPRMTTTQKNAISSPAEGLMVYDTTLHAPYYWNGSAWVAF